MSVGPITMGLGRAIDCPGTKFASWAIFRKRWRVGNAFLEGNWERAEVQVKGWAVMCGSRPGQVGLEAFWCFLALPAQPFHSHICGANLRPLNADMAPSFYKIEPA